jgi:penicillin-binding protein 1C
MFDRATATLQSPPAALARWRRWLRRLIRWMLWATAVLIFLTVVLIVLLYTVPLPNRDASLSTVVEYRDGVPAYVFLSSDDKWRLPVSVDGVEPLYFKALVELEDKRFWDHHGVDPWAMMRAGWSNVRHRRRVSGGSTLSMQVARLLEPRSRTITNKVIDMFRALQLDLRLSKREILQTYISRTPYGENVEGVESASWAYFGHSAAHLTPLEIATLLAVPQGPSVFAPLTVNPQLRSRRDAILEKLLDGDIFPAADAAQARLDAASTAPPDHLRRFPRQASHVAIWLHNQHPDDVRIRTTLDAGVQHLLTDQVALRAPELRANGINNAAVVVVDHHTRDVVGLVGNLDSVDPKHGEQIAMFNRRRSPGSTLKPFLYALAIDDGLALPGYLVPDVAAQYGDFRPSNFDNNFSGLVTLRDALSRSLNVPFVALLQQFGFSRFVDDLERMGVSSAQTASLRFGLSLIVGGIELTPLELAGLYATLASDGKSLPLRMLASVPVAQSESVFGPGAAWLTRDALSIKDRPDFAARRSADNRVADIHWKTGTSAGFHDAWAAGSGPDYTAVVWTGNADNTRSAKLIGSQAAGPLFFDVLEAIAKRHDVLAHQVPTDDVVEIDVCSYSGYVATDACQHRVKAWVPVHSVPTTRCPFHEAYDVDISDGTAATRSCHVVGHTYVAKSFVSLPSAVTAWFASHNLVAPSRPVFAATCASAADDVRRAPSITSPALGTVVTMARADTQKRHVLFTASTHAAALSWFVDGELLARVGSEQPVFWNPSLGQHHIVVSDDAGNSAKRDIVVENSQQ